MAALFLILARLVKLGFLADFLSRTVLIGFLTGVGIQVAIGQIIGHAGHPRRRQPARQKLVTDFQQLATDQPLYAGRIARVYWSSSLAGG